MNILASGASTNILAVANSPALWVAVAGIFVIIVVQSAIYITAVRKVAPVADMSSEDMKVSFRSGAVSAIGPSLAVCLVAIALIALFGTPAVLARIGLIGSAAYDVSAASIAADSMGAKLGADSYTQNVFVVAFFAMSIGGVMWMLSALIVTPLLKRGDAKIRTVNPALMAVVPSAALFGAFASLGLQELSKSSYHIVAFAASAVTMAVCLFLAKRFGMDWLREWGLGISILLALTATYFVTSS
ncbi:DUF5058 family protein [Rhodococcus opacus]|uniref:DUF5058 family protein n=1 Tax=Rhodococcus opacus TaxID=37919 RepID=UPI001C447956|nr:DUF5058 family protein [Rhodococcus opacus]MBV6759061.1 DUF5058 family protein [Rhodococcus opacus]